MTRTAKILGPALMIGLLLATAPAVSAQACPPGSDNFWKNDTLPQVPTGLTAVSVIPGLCEGEAAAQVFYLNGAPPQRIQTVAVGFGHGGGGQNFTATVNVEIYDGITWNAGVPTLGTKVFDLSEDLAAEMQVFSHAINELDLGGQDIVVGNGTTAFVVAFRMAFNPNGTCQSGHPANFFTDNGSLGSCNTIPQTSLIDILGEGWKDAKTAKLGGIIPLCPSFYNGNWVIRSCTENATDPGTGTFNDLGHSFPGNFSPTLEFSGSLLPAPDQYTFEMDGMPPSTTMFLILGYSRIDFFPFYGGTLVPDVDLLILFPTILGNLQITNSMPAGVPSGFTIYLHGWTFDAGAPYGFAGTNALEIIWP